MVYQELELIPSPSTTSEPEQLTFPSWVGEFWGSFVKALTKKPELQIWQTLDSSSPMVEYFWLYWICQYDRHDSAWKANDCQKFIWVQYSILWGGNLQLRQFLSVCSTLQFKYCRVRTYILRVSVWCDRDSNRGSVDRSIGLSHVVNDGDRNSLLGRAANVNSKTLDRDCGAGI